MTKKTVEVRGRKVEVVKGESGKLYRVRSFNSSTFDPTRRENGKTATQSD